MTVVERNCDADMRDIDRRIAMLGDAAEAILASAVTQHSAAALGPRQAGEIRLLAEACADAAIGVVLRRQPNAAELRRIVSALQVTTDYEQVASLADEVVSHVGRDRGLRDLPALYAAFDALTHVALDQFRTVLFADREHDLKLCELVWRRSRLVEIAYARVIDEALRMLSTTPQTTYVVVETLHCAKNFERIADHARTAADMLHYAMTDAHLDRDDAILKRRAVAA